MTQKELVDFYRNRKSQFGGLLTTINKKINVVSNVRLAVALLFILITYFAFSNTTLFYVLPLIVVAFTYLVREHAALFRKKVRLENLVKIQTNELQAIDGDFTALDTGAEFIDSHHSFSHDLDIFGEGSLFQHINRCSTRGGKKSLANRLISEPRSIAEIQRNQEAIQELAGKNDFRHEIQAQGLEIEEQPDDPRQLQLWLDQPSFLYGKQLYRITLILFPIITLSLLAVAIFIDGTTLFVILAAALQWTFLGFHLKKVNAFHQYIGGKKNTLEKYAQILQCIRKENFSAPVLTELEKHAQEADHKVRQLASLVSALDARLNSMTNLVVNSLLLYDLQCVYRLEKWKKENAPRLSGWIETIHETEVLCSMGTFSFNHPAFAFPHVNGDRELTARSMGHPLLSDEERVVNDLRMDRQQSIMIITGANMAGKSTFLRSLGVNVVLALSGSPVCAAEFSCPLIDMRSGMRTADSLKDHQSYFYAELDRLKSIMDELREGKPLLILLDEILKGTNSTDKQKGSVALVKQLVDHACLVLIATHDLALGDLATVYPGRISNYCFEANIENDQLSFDYKLKPGMAQKMNATFLMKKMGIIGSGFED
jgi:DNA mismatch repair ATPase MutS